MARNLKAKDIKELYAIAKDIPLPLDYDYQRAKLAALECDSQKEFLEFMEISEAVFRFWYQNSTRFKSIYDTWKEIASHKVERALAKRAIGFTKKTKRDVVTKTGQVVTLENETYYPPDTAAAQFWLKNRAPKDWKDTSQVDVNVNANIRAWLVSAMGEGDDSELIDVGPGSALALEPTETVDSLIEGSAITIDAPAMAHTAAGEVVQANLQDFDREMAADLAEASTAFPATVEVSTPAPRKAAIRDNDLFS